MNNIEAVKNLCRAIASAFIPSEETIVFLLINERVNPYEEMIEKDPIVFRIAKNLIIGFVESSRSESDISVSIDRDAILTSLKSWCSYYGLSIDDELPDVKVIENGSNLW